MTYQQWKQRVKQIMLAIALIKGSNITRYGNPVTKIRENFAMGKDDYLTDVYTAFELLNSYERLYPVKIYKRKLPRRSDSDKNLQGLQYSQTKIVPGKNG